MQLLCEPGFDGWVSFEAVSGLLAGSGEDPDAGHVAAVGDRADSIGSAPAS